MSLIAAIVNANSDSWSPTRFEVFPYIMLWFQKIHGYFFLAYWYKIVLRNQYKEFVFFFSLVVTLLYLYFFIYACIEHLKYSKETKSFFQVEDEIHFILVIEIVTFASSFLAMFISLLCSSCINERQLKEEPS